MRAKMKQAFGIAALGAVGGICFWLLAAWTGTATFPRFNGAGQISALALLGGVAALFAVYLLTTSDLNATRTYVFAILCGLTWNPIVKSGQRLAENAVATKQVDKIDESAASLKKAATAESPQEVRQQVRTLTPTVSEALKTTTDIQDAAKKKEIDQASKEAITVLRDAAPKAPTETVQGVTEISVEADKTGRPDVALDGVHTLRSIGAQQTDPSVKEAVHQSLNAVASTAQNPIVKSNAQIALKDMHVGGNGALPPK